MNRNKAITLYLSGTLGQIGIVCIFVLILRRMGMVVDYTTPLGIMAVALGGVSSALWGTIIAIKYKKYSFKKVLRDFFAIKQKCSSYLLALMFLSLFFCYVAFNGKLTIATWYTPIILFFQMIIFGGIEEIGWRYIFQPILQERHNYIISTLITFFSWGVWHFSFFYIDGSLSQINVVEFSIGLLVNCFILSALFIKTKSLWICVMTHALINVLSQLAIGGNSYVGYASKVIIIVIAIIISIKNEKSNLSNRYN